MLVGCQGRHEDLIQFILEQTWSVHDFDYLLFCLIEQIHSGISSLSRNLLKRARVKTSGMELRVFSFEMACIEYDPFC